MPGVFRCWLGEDSGGSEAGVYLLSDRFDEWCWRLQRGEKLSISEITAQFVELNKAETAEPNERHAKIYRELQGLQDEVSRSLRQVFGRHREFVLNQV